jgi:hypothetical protein
MSLRSGGPSVPWRSLRSLCGSSFLIGILHTEIVKDAKTDPDWMSLRSGGPSVPWRSLQSLCGSSFFDRNFTHGDRKGRKDRSGLDEPSIRWFVRTLAIFAISVWIVDDLCWRDENEFGFRVDKPEDQSWTCHAIDFRAFTTNPVHRVFSSLGAGLQHSFVCCQRLRMQRGSGSRCERKKTAQNGKN